MGTSASTGGSSLTKQQSQSTHEITAKIATPGPRPYSAHFKKIQQQEIERAAKLSGTNSSLRKSSKPSSSKLSNYNTNYSESLDQYRVELHKNKNLFNLTPNEALKIFLSIQYKLDIFEANGVLEGLKSVETELQIVQANKLEAENIYRMLYEKNEKEKVNDFFAPTVQSFYMNREQNDGAMTTEQNEYLQNLNLLEIAENEFRQVNQQYNQSKKIHNAYKKEYKKAIKLQGEQMNILYTIFQGDYGSELEERLEKELGDLTDNKDQLKSALIKLVHSRSLIIYSYNKLQTAEEKWIDLIHYDIRDKEKVFLATEVRNNLAAAYHYLNNTRSYLKHEDMPYCSEQDLKNLLYQAAAVYNEMASVEAQRNVLKNIQFMRKRCLGMSQWFETVIKMFMPLMTQHSIISNQYDHKKEELKRERIRLLDEIIKERGGGITQDNLTEYSDSLNKDSVDSKKVTSASKKTRTKSGSRANSSSKQNSDLSNKNSKDTAMAVETEAAKIIAIKSMTPRKSLSKITIEDNNANKTTELITTESAIRSARQNDSTKQKEAELQGFHSASLNGNVKLVSVRSSKKLDGKEAFINEENESNQIRKEKNNSNCSLIESKTTFNTKTNEKKNSPRTEDKKNSGRFVAGQLTENKFYNESTGKVPKGIRDANEQNLISEQQKNTLNKTGKEGNQPGILKVKESDQSNTLSTEGSNISTKDNVNTNNIVKKERSYTELLMNKYKDNPLLSSLMNPEIDDTLIDTSEFIRPVQASASLNNTINNINNNKPEGIEKDTYLPLPPSRDQILVHAEQIKQRYKQQEAEWNRMMSKSRIDADSRLFNILQTHERTRLNSLKKDD